MMNQKIEGILRHIGTILSGILLFIGLDEGTVDELNEVVFTAVGAIIALVAFIRSWVTKDDEIIEPELQGIMADPTKSRNKLFYSRQTKSYISVPTAKVNEQYNWLLAQHNLNLKLLNETSSVEYEKSWMQYVGAIKALNTVMPRFVAKKGKTLPTEISGLKFDEIT